MTGSHLTSMWEEYVSYHLNWIVVDHTIVAHYNSSITLLLVNLAHAL